MLSGTRGGSVDAQIRRFRYARAALPVLEDVELHIGAGDFVVLAGKPASGKTTLGMCLAGVIPHMVHGDFDGTVVVAGHPLAELRLPRIAGLVGFVQQAPSNQLFNLTVGEDVAFGPENLGLKPEEVRRRAQRALDAVGIADLAERSPHELSGGQQQRAVLASVLALEPACWIFDQPVAELDPVGRAEVYNVISTLNAAGHTIVVIEERLSEVVHMATRVVLLDERRIAADTAPAEFFRSRRHIQPSAGVRAPLPVQVFHSLSERGVQLERVPLSVHALVDQLRSRWPRHMVRMPDRTRHSSQNNGRPLCSIRRLAHRYPNGTLALSDVSFDLHAGECAALIGANGAGKSTLARHLIGLLEPTEGEVRVLDHDTRSATPAELSRHVGFLFQDPDYQIFTLTVLDEVVFGLRAHKVPADEARKRALFELGRVGLAEVAEMHPYRLSRGQRQLVALASILALDPSLIVVDEPSTGLDYAQTRAIMDLLDAFRASGRSVLLITHDIEMVLRYAERAIIMAGGHVVADLPTRELGLHRELLAQCGVRLPEIFDLEAALGLEPAFCEAEDVAAALLARRD